MARKHPFPYRDYLASSHPLNQIVIVYAFTGENFEGLGGEVKDPQKEFPEIYEMLERLVDLDELPPPALDIFDDADFIMASHHPIDGLKVHFAIKKPLKGGGSQVTHSLRNIISMNISLEDEPSFNIHFVGKA